MKPGAIQITIDAIVIHSPWPVDTLQVKAAVLQELTRLMEAGNLAGMDAKSRHLERADGGVRSLPRQATPAQLGAHIARSVYESISGAGVPETSTPTTETGANRP
ncbi:MAG: hypothetical protein D6681_17955 [Calditrichaeota bacterium]|nr:MAG: hypothetical protein D6681_17955 [Calditrichota bacterium]